MLDGWLTDRGALSGPRDEEHHRPPTSEHWQADLADSAIMERCHCQIKIDPVLARLLDQLLPSPTSLARIG